MQTSLIISPCLILFFMGLWGLLSARNNMMLVIISLELSLLSVNVGFSVLSVQFDDISGQIFSLLVLVVAAAESAIGLAILIIYYRAKGNIDMNYSDLLKR